MICDQYAYFFSFQMGNDQFDISKFEELIVLAEVLEVTHGQEKRPLDKVNQYSRIGRLLKVISSMGISE